MRASAPALLGSSWQSLGGSQAGTLQKMEALAKTDGHTEKRMETKASNIIFAWCDRVAALILGLGLCGGMASQERDGVCERQHGTVKDFLTIEVRPVAMGHHG